MLSLIFGQRIAAGNGFLGWESSADLSFGAETKHSVLGSVCSVDGAAGPYLCEHQATVRIVGTYARSVGAGTEVFGSLGVGVLRGDYADSPGSVISSKTYGATLGLGFNRDFGRGLTARGEVIYDRFDSNTQELYDPTYSGATIRFALVRRF